MRHVRGSPVLLSFVLVTGQHHQIDSGHYLSRSDAKSHPCSCLTSTLDEDWASPRFQSSSSHAIMTALSAARIFFHGLLVSYPCLLVAYHSSRKCGCAQWCCAVVLMALTAYRIHYTKGSDSGNILTSQTHYYGILCFGSHIDCFLTQNFRSCNR